MSVSTLILNLLFFFGALQAIAIEPQKLSGSTVQSKEMKSQDLRRNRVIMVYFEAQSDAAARLSSEIPDGMKVVALETNAAVVEPVTYGIEDALLRLKKIRGIKAVYPSSIVRARKTESNCTGESEAASQSFKAKDCAGHDKACKHESRWAQRRVAADLMDEYATDKSLHSAAMKTPVFVIDTGFDASWRNSMMNPANFKVEPGLVSPEGKSLVGDLESDEGGHGTMVAGFIGAKNGIGVAPNASLTVYRITKGRETSTEDAFLQMSILRACHAGKKFAPDSVPIINVSWGSEVDESGKNPDEIKKRELLDELTSQGCLVVKSAGNSSYRNRNLTSDNMDGPYIRSSAIDEYGDLANFSVNGSIPAPGEDVLGIFSRSNERTKPGDKCGDYRFTSGTSFSAPIVAGIASEIQGALRADPGKKFQALSNSSKITIINRILRASIINNSVNGLRALLIAERWRNGTSTDVPTVEELTKSIEHKKPDYCADPVKTYDADLNCDQIRAVFDEHRKRLISCPESLSMKHLTESMSVAVSLNQYTQSPDFYRAAYDRADSVTTKDRLAVSYAGAQFGDRLFWSDMLKSKSQNDLFFWMVATVTVVPPTRGKIYIDNYLDAARRSTDRTVKMRAAGLVFGLMNGLIYAFETEMKEEKGNAEQHLALAANSVLKLKLATSEAAAAEVVKNFLRSDGVAGASDSYSLVPRLRTAMTLWRTPGLEWLRPELGEALDHLARSLVDEIGLPLQKIERTNFKYVCDAFEIRSQSLGSLRSLNSNRCSQFH